MLNVLISSSSALVKKQLDGCSSVCGADFDRFVELQLVVKKRNCLTHYIMCLFRTLSCQLQTVNMQTYADICKLEKEQTWTILTMAVYLLKLGLYTEKGINKRKRFTNRTLSSSMCPHSSGKLQTRTQFSTLFGYVEQAKCFCGSTEIITPVELPWRQSSDRSEHS